MNLNKINEIALKVMSKRKAHLSREKGFIYYHGQRVAKLSLNIRKKMFPEDASLDDIIYTAALFHDVAKGIEPHHITGAALISTLIGEACTEEELDKISKIIEKHNSRNKNELPDYIKIVQDADILDHFGTMEIWMKFMYSAYAEENVFDALRLWESEEFHKYLEKSRQELNYEFSKEIFDRKIEFELQFQERFKLESEGEYY